MNQESPNKKVKKSLFTFFGKEIDQKRYVNRCPIQLIVMREEGTESGKVEKILLELNKTGLSYLKYLQFKEAIQFFKKAERIVNEEMMVSTDNQKINQLAGVTFNNLACYYKKTKRPKVALHYLQKSLEIEVYKTNDWVSTGSTHLNICAIYSYLGKHEQALSHAKLALELLEKQPHDKNDVSEEGRSFWNIKMLCYYNMAIEEEHLKILEKALQSYIKAKETAKVFGAKNVGIVLSCDEAISRIEGNLAELRKKMIRYFVKKKEDEETGYYQYMRKHKQIPKLVSSKAVSEEKIRRFSLYQSQDTRKRIGSIQIKNNVQPQLAQVVSRRTNSTKFKSLNDYFNKKYKTETDSEKNPK